MQSDAHIEDVLHTLADPEDFVRGIVGSFLGEQFNRDEAVVESAYQVREELRIIASSKAGPMRC